jgi:hypothetical protein
MVLVFANHCEDQDRSHGTVSTLELLYAKLRTESPSRQFTAPSDNAHKPKDPKTGDEIWTCRSKKTTVQSVVFSIISWLGLSYLFQTLEGLDSIKDKQTEIEIIRNLLGSTDDGK